MQRKAGILLHISSLPNKYGIGTLGKAAYQFVDFLPRTSNMKKKLMELEGEEENGRINQAIS